MISDTQPIRRGEELNEQQLALFLRDQLGASTDEISITQFPAGNSNLTYSVKIGADEYVLRRPPFGNQVKTAHDMAREFKVLTHLAKVYAPAPKPLLYSADESIIGSEFYLMERRRGLIIRGRVPEILENSAELREQVCGAFIENLAELHALDFEKLGLGDFGKPADYARRQVEGWTKRYFNAKTDEHAALEHAVEWLNAHIPPSNAPALVHNDYKFDNIMLDPHNLTQITAVLDWEMATIGDPLMDLGTTLGYWMSREAGAELLSMPFNPRVLMENLTRAQLVEIYAEKSGRDVSDMLFYYVFGTFKIAVIAQQIYFRYAKGHTTDKRFARFNQFVGALGRIADYAIQTGRV